MESGGRARSHVKEVLGGASGRGGHGHPAPVPSPSSDATHLAPREGEKGWPNMDLCVDRFVNKTSRELPMLTPAPWGQCRIPTHNAYPHQCQGRRCFGFHLKFFFFLAAYTAVIDAECMGEIQD